MNNVRLFFAGDFCSKPATSVITVTDELKELIQSCDIKAINFEVPLKPDGVDLPQQRRERFFQNDDAPVFLRRLGFNLFQLANNHIFDWGEEGFKKTKAALGDDSFGAGSYDEAYQIKVVELHGVKFGFMALSFAAYIGSFDDVMNHDGYGCSYINDLRVNHDIIEAKKKVDYLFILPHDGIEYISVPIPETIARYRDFIDYGADGVIASHPHCPQGWEEYKGKPIFYSLGNFLFNSKEGYDYRATNRPHWYDGLCVVLTVSAEGLSYEVLNTKNVDNVRIEIDHSDESLRYNQYLCNLIDDAEKYRVVLDPELQHLSTVQELPIIDRSIHEHGLKSTIKHMVIFTVRKLLGMPQKYDDRELTYLLKNQTRLSFLSRYLEVISNK